MFQTWLIRLHKLGTLFAMNEDWTASMAWSDTFPRWVCGRKCCEARASILALVGVAGLVFSAVAISRETKLAKPVIAEHPPDRRRGAAGPTTGDQSSGGAGSQHRGVVQHRMMEGWWRSGGDASVAGVSPIGHYRRPGWALAPPVAQTSAASSGPAFTRIQPNGEVLVDRGIVALGRLRVHS